MIIAKCDTAKSGLRAFAKIECITAAPIEPELCFSDVDIGEDGPVPASITTTPPSVLPETDTLDHGASRPFGY